MLNYGHRRSSAVPSAYLISPFVGLNAHRWNRLDMRRLSLMFQRCLLHLFLLNAIFVGGGDWSAFTWANPCVLKVASHWLTCTQRSIMLQWYVCHVRFRLCLSEGTSPNAPRKVCSRSNKSLVNSVETKLDHWGGTSQNAITVGKICLCWCLTACEELIRYYLLLKCTLCNNFPLIFYCRTARNWSDYFVAIEFM